MSPSYDLPPAAIPGAAAVPMVPITPLPADVAAARPGVSGNRGIKVQRSCTILAPAADIYAFWRNVENLAPLISKRATIVRLSDLESRWSVQAPPGDSRVEWVSVIISDHPAELLVWQSREGAEVPNAGSVRFQRAPGDEGTEVVVNLEYDPPGGALGAWVAKLSGEEPGQLLTGALRRFKALMETGEIPTIDGQAVGEPQLSRRKNP